MKTVQRNKQKGMALMLVLWVSLFLSVILAAAISAIRIDAKIIRADMEQFQFEQAAKGAMIHTLHELSDQTRGQAPALLPIRKSLGGYELEISLSPEMEKVDINLASEQALATVFTSAGLEPEDATIFAARIADWRDADDLTRPNGAEKRDYTTTQNGERIGNRPFLSVKELNSVLGTDPEIVACALDQLSVVGQAQPITRLAQNNSITPGARIVLKASLNGNNLEQTLQATFLMTGRRDSPVSMVKTIADTQTASKCS